MSKMSRLKLINSIISKNKYKSYLEIGTQGDVCLSQIQCEYKVGIDPAPIFHDDKNSNKFFEICSDDFFRTNTDTFDIIFVDGFHHSVQVREDVLNSLKILNKGGTIIVHDCSPDTFDAQTIPETHLPTWNGDVWKAWMWFRINRADLTMYVVDVDTGCGVITRGGQELIIHDTELTFDNLDKNRVKWLNLVNYEEV